MMKSAKFSLKNSMKNMRTSRNLFQQWKDDPENIESIRSIRRVFHTFKGSGRLVGAKALSSFSWSMESLLNRVLDGSRPATENVVNMIQLAIASLAKIQNRLAWRRGQVGFYWHC